MNMHPRPATDNMSRVIDATGVVNSPRSQITETNNEGEITGTGPVPLRGMQGFANQENVRPRDPLPTTSRLTNGKLGE